MCLMSLRFRRALQVATPEILKAMVATAGAYTAYVCYQIAAHGEDMSLAHVKELWIEASKQSSPQPSPHASPQLSPPADHPVGQSLISRLWEWVQVPEDQRPKPTPQGLCNRAILQDSVPAPILVGGPDGKVQLSSATLPHSSSNN